MKREYKSPVAKYVNYAYEEQVVAASDQYYNGYGDGNQTGYCTYQSGAVSNPCTSIVSSSFPVNICGAQPWSLG